MAILRKFIWQIVMHIHIISNQQSPSCDELLFKRTESHFQKIKLNSLFEDLTWSFAKNIDQESDLYLEIITEQQVKIGFMPISLHSCNTSKLSDWCSDDLHWVTVIGQSLEQCDLISQIILFTTGLLCVPSQTGSYMTDLTDMKIALQHGTEAKYISFSELDDKCWSNSKKVASSIMLFNADVSISKKLGITADLIPQSYVEHDYLNIMNITNTNHLPQINKLLLIY